MDRDLPLDPRISFIVRVVRRRRRVTTGVVEQIGTGRKQRFSSATELGRVIERIVAEQRAAAQGAGRRVRSRAN